MFINFSYKTAVSIQRINFQNLLSECTYHWIKLIYYGIYLLEKFILVFQSDVRFFDRAYIKMLKFYSTWERKNYYMEDALATLFLILWTHQWQ